MHQPYADDAATTLDSMVILNMDMYVPVLCIYVTMYMFNYVYTYVTMYICNYICM